MADTLETPSAPYLLQSELFVSRLSLSKLTSEVPLPAGRSGCQEHLKCGDILLTQWPVSNKPRSLNGNAWLECLLSSSVRRASLEIFFSKEGDVPEGNESMPTREYSKSKDFLEQSRPLADVLPAQYLELKTSPGRFRNRLHVAENPKCPKWLQKPLRPKTLGLFQATGFLS